MKHQAPRGTRDLLPGETERWQWAESRAHGVLERYGYREIRTPLFEDYELFARTSGESSDVVQKEMYRFKDLKGRDLALRPENTAGACRAYLEHGLASQGRVHRLWYLGPMFRYGRPQKGRYRQFSQVGAELIGTDSPWADVEMIALFVDLFEAWGFLKVDVAVNTVGTPESRRAYGDRLRQWLAPVAERMSADSRTRLETNPMRVLDTKDPDDHALMKDPTIGPMPTMLDSLPEPEQARFAEVRRGLAALGVETTLDHGLVRGLDYYTHTAFEVHDRSLGAQSTLGGGGRYDGLIAELGGPQTPGIGFSIGMDRVLAVLEERGFDSAPRSASVFLAAMQSDRTEAQKLVRALRREFTVDCDLDGRGLGAQMKAADKSGAAWLVLLGEDEWARGEVVLKDLKTGHQETVANTKLIDELRARMSRATQVNA